MDLAGHDLWTKKLGEVPWHAELREENSDSAPSGAWQRSGRERRRETTMIHDRSKA